MTSERFEGRLLGSWSRCRWLVLVVGVLAPSALVVSGRPAVPVAAAAPGVAVAAVEGPTSAEQARHDAVLASLGSLPRPEADVVASPDSPPPPLAAVPGEVGRPLPVAVPESDPVVVAIEAATAQASASGVDVVVDALTSETGITVARPDGLLQTSVSAGQERFRDAQGSWQELDLSLVEVGSAPEVLSARLAAGAAKVAKAARPDMVSRATPAGVFSWAPEGVADAAVVVERSEKRGSKVRYPGALGSGRDYVVEVHALGVKDSLVLADRASGPARFVQVVKAPVGVRAQPSQGVVQFVDGQGAVVAAYGGGMVVDSSVNEVGEPAMVPVTTRLLGQSGRTVRVEVSVDEAWYDDPARVFPVTVDPYWEGTTASVPGHEAYVDAAFPNTAQGVYDSSRLLAGTRPVNGAARNSQSLIWIQIGNLAGTRAYISEAVLDLPTTYSGSCQPETVEVAAAASWWSPNTVTWNNRPARVGRVLSEGFAAGYSSACPAGTYPFDVQPIVQAWSDGLMPNEGFHVSVPSTWVGAYKRFGTEEGGAAPRLRLVWENCSQYPAATGRLVCGANRDKYNALGGPGVVGYPIIDERSSDGVGTYNHYDRNGSIFWSPGTGAHWVKNAIHDKWAQLGWQDVFGYPTSDETASLDGRGAYSHFVRLDGRRNGSIFWHPDIGARAVEGGIRDQWAQVGWERGFLAYPTSDEVPVPGGARSSFQGGTITWRAKDDTFEVATFGARMVAPVANQRTARRLPLSVEVDDSWHSSRTSPRFEYRRGAADAWKPVPLTGGQVTTKDGAPLSAWPSMTAAGDAGDGSGSAARLAAPGNVVYWDAGTALNGVGGVLDVRAVFATDRPVDATTATNGAPTAPVPGVVFDPDAGQAPSSAIGPGSVNLLTGDYDVDVTDASAFGVSITRSASSRRVDQGTKDKAAGAFGGQWALGGVDEANAVDYTAIRKTSDVSLDLVSADATTLPFTLRAGTTDRWDPAPGLEAWTLTGALTGTTFALTETDGTTTTFTRQGTVTDVWPASETTPSTGDGTRTKTRYKWVVDTGAKLRLTRIAAPNPALSDAAATACLNDAVPAAGCRVLALDWGVPAGGFTGDRVRAVTLWAADPGATTSRQTTLVTYTYNAAGDLTGVSDPRPTTDTPATPALTTAYTYDAARRLTSVTPPGERPWTMTYNDATVAGPGWDRALTGSGSRLLRVTRDTLTPGTQSSVNGTATWAVVYGVPLAVTANGPHDMTPATVATWGQDVPPTDAAAVLPPDPVTGAQPTTDYWAADDASARDWSRATTTYMDVNGRTSNTAAPASATTGARITAAGYDYDGNPTFELSAANRALALGQAPAPGGDPTAILTGLGINGLSTPDRARMLATLTTYEKGVSKAARPVTTQEPLHLLTAGSGPGLAAVPGRSVTVTSYDQNRPADPAPPAAPHVSDLPTTTVEGTLTGTTLVPAPSAAALVDTRTSTTGYDWKLGLPTQTVADVGGTNITRTTTYDTIGWALTETMPKDAAAPGGKAGTRTTTYYGTAAGECAGPDALVFGGQVCATGPAGQVSGGVANPAWTPTTRPTYNRAGAAVGSAEHAGLAASDPVLRTTTTTLDTSDRARSATVSTTGSGAATLTRTMVYDPTTGDLVSTSGEGRTITATTDTLGRATSYTDGSGLSTTTRYDALDRPTQVTESLTRPGLSTLTYTSSNGYDPTSGLLTSVTDPHTGPVAALFDRDGNLIKQSYTGAAPGTLAMTQAYDPTGTPVARAWTLAPAGGGPVQTLMGETVTGNGHGQWVTHGLATGGVPRARTYGYDSTGRLTAATDTRTPAGATAAACSTRGWAYDTNGNRTGRASTTAPAGQGCPTTPVVPVLHTFDSADRLIDPGYAYDGLGRTTTMATPAVTGPPAPNSTMTLAYAANDLVAEQRLYANQTDAAAGGATWTERQTYTIDPTGERFASTTIATTTGAPATITKTNHYAGTSDSPDWITEGDATTTRHTTSPAGDLATITTLDTAGTATTSWQIATLHGDITATVPNSTGATLTTLPATDEYGLRARW